MADAVVTASIAFATVVAAAVAAVTAVAWWRERRTRFALLAAAFLVFFGKAAYLSWGLWTAAEPLRLLAVAGVLDVGFLVVLYLAVVKR